MAKHPDIYDVVNRKYLLWNIKIIVCKDAFVGSDSESASIVIQKTTETKDLADTLFQQPPQKRVRKKTDDGKEQQEYWDSLLALVVAGGTWPTTVVEDRNFQKFCQSLNKDVSLLFVGIDPDIHSIKL